MEIESDLHIRRARLTRLQASGDFCVQIVGLCRQLTPPASAHGPQVRVTVAAALFSVSQRVVAKTFSPACVQNVLTNFPLAGRDCHLDLCAPLQGITVFYQGYSI